MRNVSGRISNFKKITLLSLVGFCVAISWIGSIDRWAENYVNEAIVQATIAYGSARALNAAISFAQSAQVGFSAGGEISVHPGEILDPVNDMVEDYATAMKYSISSLIIQKLLIEMLANNLFKWLMLAGGVILCISLLFLSGAWTTIFFKSFAFIALIRFIFVATILIVSVVEGSFLNEQSNTYIETVDKATKAIELRNNASNALSPQEKMIINRQILENETQQKEVQEKIQELKKKIRSAENDVQVSKSNLDFVKKGGSQEWKTKLKELIIDNDQVAPARRELEESKKIRDKLSSAREKEIEELENLQDNQSDLQKKLQGKESFISSVKRKVSSIRSLLETESVKQRLKSSIKAMLYLIALFLLKTLLLPIAFLFLILRSFKLIWKIDLPAFLGVKLRDTKVSP